MMTQQEKMERAIAIAEVVMSTGNAIANHISEMPRVGKRKNPFNKTYNRRPNTKRKIRKAIAKASVDSYFGAIQLARILSTPIPKFNKGGK